MHRKESIVFTTIDVINDQGIVSVSTKEIARRQGISESVIFRIFPKKVDLLAAVIDYYSLYDADLFKTAQVRGLEPREAILFYMEAMSSYLENYPAITVITQLYDVFRYEPLLESKIRNVLDNRIQFIKTQLENACKAGEFKSGISCEDFAGLILSTARGICLNWRMCGYSFSLKEKIMNNTTILLQLPI